MKSHKMKIHKITKKSLFEKRDNA